VNKIISYLTEKSGTIGRYLLVSALNVVNHQVLLQIGLRLFEWSGGFANVVAAMISVIPAFLLSRYWVWQVSGSASLKSEIVPFWVIAVIGLVVSSGTAQWADNAFGEPLLVSAASLAGYLLVWVAKFFVLNGLFSRAAM